MTSADAFASHRALIRDAVAKALSSMPHGYAQPMRDQLSVFESTSGEERFLPALLCLETAEAMGATTELALSSATALALLEVMGLSFASLWTDRSDDLAARWGLGRSLNAGDGFFALAQRSVLSARGVGAGRGLAAAAAFDAVCNRFSQAIYDEPGVGLEGGSAATLFEGAAVLGGLVAVADSAKVELLRRFGEAMATGSGLEASLGALPPEIRPRLESVAQDIARRRPR